MADTTLSPNDQSALRQGKTFVWHELCVPNTQAALAFYSEALGMGTTEMPMGDMGNYTMLTVNGAPVCGVMSTELSDSPDTPPHWATYLSVDDVDARLAKCEALGATVVVPAMDVPTVGRMGLIRDPQGAHIWLFKSSGE